MLPGNCLWCRRRLAAGTSEKERPGSLNRTFPRKRVPRPEMQRGPCFGDYASRTTGIIIGLRRNLRFTHVPTTRRTTCCSW